MPPLTGNVTPNYARVITRGFDKTREEIEASMAKAEDATKRAYGAQMLSYLDICESISDAYRALALEKGNERLAKVLSSIPRCPSRSSP